MQLNFRLTIFCDPSKLKINATSIHIAVFSSFVSCFIPVLCAKRLGESSPTAYKQGAGQGLFHPLCRRKERQDVLFGR